MNSETVTLPLDPDCALVLFEWLHSLGEESDTSSIEAMRPRFSHPGEYVALMRLLGALESTLVEPFETSYESKVKDARARLWTRFSGEE